MQTHRRFLIISAVLTIGLCLAYLASTAKQDAQADAPLSAKPAEPNSGQTELTQPQRIETNERATLETADEQVDPKLDSKTLLLRGRCLSGGSKQPLAGCSARTRRETPSSSPEAPWAGTESTATTSTSADGIFELQVPLHTDHENVALQLTKNGFVSRIARWKRPSVGSVIDVGDIELDPSIQVTGKVTYPDGEPVMDVGILFANVALTGQAKVEPERMLRTKSDAAGGFRLPAPAFFGEWYPRVEGSGALIEPQMVVLTQEHHPDYDIHLIVERPDPELSINGTCVDESGRSMAQIQVSAAGDGFRGQGWSRADGTVTIPRGGPTPQRGKLFLRAYDKDREYEHVLPTSDAEIQWGDDDIQFVLRRLAKQFVHVVDNKGESISEFSLFAFDNQDGRPARYPHLSQHGEHPDGRIKLDRLKNGENFVLVVPKEPGLGPTNLVPFIADSSISPGTLTVTVPDLSSLDVQIHDPSGAPVNGSRVELLQSILGVDPKVTSEAVDVGDCDRSRYSPRFVRHAEGLSDANGTAHVLASPGTWFLRISGASHMPLMQKIQVLEGHTTIPVTVQAGASLTGKVSPISALESLAQLAPDEAKPVTVELRVYNYSSPILATVQPDGTFSFGGITPDKYKVSLRYWMHTSTVTEGWRKVPIAEIELSEGQHEDLVIDAQACLPGQISGHIFVNGEPLKDKHCFARRVEPRPNIMLRFATDSEGHFEANIPPGIYSYSITLEAIPGPGWVMMTLFEQWSLDPGGSRETSHNIELRTIRVQVLSESGTPLANQDLQLTAPGFRSPGPFHTNESGWVTIGPAPLSAFHLTATIDGEKRRIGPIDLPPGQTAGDVTIRMEPAILEEQGQGSR